MGPCFSSPAFDVIKAYNGWAAYALSVSLLGDAVPGGPSLNGDHDPRSAA
jgi:membrane-bound lytic murein transglycosylase B